MNLGQWYSTFGLSWALAFMSNLWLLDYRLAVSSVLRLLGIASRWWVWALHVVQDYRPNGLVLFIFFFVFLVLAASNRYWTKEISFPFACVLVCQSIILFSILWSNIGEGLELANLWLGSGKCISSIEGTLSDISQARILTRCPFHALLPETSWMAISCGSMANKSQCLARLNLLGLNLIALMISFWVFKICWIWACIIADRLEPNDKAAFSAWQIEFFRGLGVFFICHSFLGYVCIINGSICFLGVFCYHACELVDIYNVFTQRCIVFQYFTLIFRD